MLQNFCSAVILEMAKFESDCELCAVLKKKISASQFEMNVPSNFQMSKWIFILTHNSWFFIVVKYMFKNIDKKKVQGVKVGIGNWGFLFGLLFLAFEKKCNFGFSYWFRYIQQVCMEWATIDYWSCSFLRIFNKNPHKMLLTKG